MGRIRNKNGRNGDDQELNGDNSEPEWVIILSQNGSEWEQSGLCVLAPFDYRLFIATPKCHTHEVIVTTC